MSEVEDGLSVRMRLVLLLSPYHFSKDDLVCPREMSQAGMAEKLGLPRNHIAVELGRAVAKGLIGVGSAHVNGFKCNVKVYFLTPLGVQLAMQTKRELHEEHAQQVFKSSLEARIEERSVADPREAAKIEDWEQPRTTLR